MPLPCHSRTTHGAVSMKEKKMPWEREIAPKFVQGQDIKILLHEKCGRKAV